MKTKLLRKLHKYYRWKFVDDQLIVFNDKDKIAYKYNEIFEFIIDRCVDHLSIIGLTNYHRKKRNILWKNEHRRLYNELNKVTTS